MALPPVFGHETLKNRLAGAIASSRFPQSALLSGQVGVGKQRIALWVAQALLCEQTSAGHPCGRCTGCTRVSTLSHPDLHWFIPIPRPKGQDPAKQVEEAESSLAEAMAERRKKSQYGRPDGMDSHSIASVRLLQRKVILTPAIARKKVVIVGDAERLVVQESSPEAANAMLKVLEEPPADTVVLLTVADPQALLPTIRSRLVPIRVGPISDEAVRQYLSTEADPLVTGAALDRRVLLAEGSIGRAIWADTDTEKADRAAEAFLSAVAKGPAGWSAAALSQVPWHARGEYTALLDAVSLRIRLLLKDDRTADRTRAVRWSQALQRVETARWEAQGNANPRLGLAVLGQDLQRLL